MAGVSVAGAGADATNIINTKVDAFVLNSNFASVGDVIVNAINTSTTDAKVVGVAAAIGGGLVGVGVAIGAATSENLIGWNDGGAPKSEVLAFVRNSSADLSGALTISAVDNAKITSKVDADAVALAGGLVAAAASGAGASAKNKISTDVEGFIDTTVGDGIFADGDIQVTADELSQIDVETLAVSISASFGLFGGSIAIGIALADNTISNTLVAGVKSADITTVAGDLTVKANNQARMDASSAAAAVAASVSIGGSFSGGGASAKDTITNSSTANIDASRINLNGDLTVKAENGASATTDVKVTSISLGLIAAAAAGSVSLVSLTLPTTSTVANSDVSAKAIYISADSTESQSANATGLSVSTGVSVGISTATATAKGAITAGVGAATTIVANELHIDAVGADTLDAKSQASSGAILASGAGTVSIITVDRDVTSIMGDGSSFNGATFVARSVHNQYVDGKSDAKSLGLGAGAGGAVTNTLSGVTSVDIGKNVAVNADSIVISATNMADKNKYSNDANLRSGSAGGISLTAMISKTDIGTSSNRFAALVNVGDGTNLIVAGSEANPGRFDISTLADVNATDSVRVEGVSGFSVSMAASTINAYTQSAVNVGSATLVNNSGDLYLTTRTNSDVKPSANLFTASVLSGISGAAATGVVDAQDEVIVKDAKLRGGTVYLLAGVDKNGVMNILDGSAAADMTTLSMFPNLSIPVPLMSIKETNLVDLQGNTVVQALGNIYLRSKEGIGGDKRGSISANTLSLSMIPYGTAIDKHGFVTADRQVMIGTNVRVEAALNNQALLWILPMYVSGEGGYSTKNLIRVVLAQS